MTMEVSALAIHSNLFSCGDFHLKQLLGTAPDTPVDILRANILLLAWNTGVNFFGTTMGTRGRFWPDLVMKLLLGTCQRRWWCQL
jgi:hypothetical protein